MSTVDCADPNWAQKIFESTSKVQSTFRGPDSSDVPVRFKGSGVIAGKTDFLAWASLPEITYSANPETLYNLKKLEKKLSESECFVKKTVDAQEKIGVTYPTSFYIGLAAGGAAIVYALISGGK